VLWAALSGGLLVAACTPWDLWPLAWVGVVPLLWAVDHASTARRAGLVGWVAGVVANAGGFYWIIGLLQRFGQLPLALAVPLFLALSAYQGLLFALFGNALWRARRRGHPMVLVAPVAMVAFELAVPFIFPWYLAITQAWQPRAIQIAELTGPLGVTGLLLVANGLLYDLAQRRVGRSTWVGSALLVGAVVFGHVRLGQIERRRAAAPHRRVGLVQGNIGMTEKWEPELRQGNLVAHQRASDALHRAGAQLIVWSESAYPYALPRSWSQDFPIGDSRRLRSRFTAPLLFGAITLGDLPSDPLPYNSALMMQSDGRVTGLFDKNFLLVFGEYIPGFELLERLRARGGWIGRLADIRQYVPMVSQFQRGTQVTTFGWDGFRLAPLICYEDILPSFGRRLAPLAPHLLVNLTNDAWFGATAEPIQHLALSVFRAVELRVDLVRAVNTGVSAVVDATGRVGMKTRAVDPTLAAKAGRSIGPETLVADVALVEGGHTFYAFTGDWLGWLCLALLVRLVWRRSP
jgi:apolipoprotein N-acyltransferase